MPQDPPVAAGGIAEEVPGIWLECLERGLAVAFQLSVEARSLTRLPMAYVWSQLAGT